MEDWSQDFFAMLEAATQECEQFFQDVGEIVEVVSQEIHNAIVVEVEQLVQDFWEPIVGIYNELELEIDTSLDDFASEADSLITYKLESSLNHHPACMGCSHYHGQVYGGNLLVCGMHPYGWDDENCPDWEKF